MKKIFTYLALCLTTFAVQAQVVETILLEETFETELIDASLSTSGELYSLLNFGFDGVSGVGGLYMWGEDWNADLDLDLLLSWEIPEGGTDADSIVTEFKIAKEFGTESSTTYVTEHWQYKGLLLAVSLDHPSVFYPAITDEFLNVTLAVEYTSRDYIIEDNDDYFTVKKVYKNPKSSIDIINMSGYTYYEINGVFFSDIYIFADEWCSANFPGDDACRFQLEDQLSNGVRSTSLLIDDLKVTAYKTVTGIEDEIYNDKQVLAVYNLMGQESSLETTNETIIVRYTDGTSERVFNVK